MLLRPPGENTTWVLFSKTEFCFLKQSLVFQNRVLFSKTESVFQNRVLFSEFREFWGQTPNYRVLSAKLRSPDAGAARNQLGFGVVSMALLIYEFAVGAPAPAARGSERVGRL